MASIFGVNQGVLMIKYMPHKTTITGQVYADTLKELRENIKEKRRGKLLKGIIILHGNAPIHKANVTELLLSNAALKNYNIQPIAQI